jgi:hypothetical protein
MFGLIDMVSMVAIFSSVAVIIYNIRSELKIKV